MKLVIVTSRFPWPIEKGDKLRIFHQLKYLSERYEILLISVADEIPEESALEELRQYCAEIKYYTISKLRRICTALYYWINGKPAQVGYFFSSKIKRKIYQEIIQFQPDRIYCQLIRVSDYVKTLPHVKILDYMDTLSSGMARQAEVRKFPASLFYKREAVLTRQYEQRVYSFFDETTIISERDKNELPLLSKNLIHVIPNGIDANFYIPINKVPEYDLVFVGNLGYKPNEEAVFNLLKYYRINNLNHKVLIAGARPTKAILAINEKNWNIAGWVDDIRSAYNNAKIFVAPLTIGSGLQNKILEAMSCGLPCITTTLVNEAIGAEEDNEILIANDSTTWMEKVNLLLEDEELRRTVGKNARTFVLNNYLWTGFNSKLNNVITDAKSKAQFTR